VNELNLALVNSLHPQEELERLAIASEVFRRRLDYKYNLINTQLNVTLATCIAILICSNYQ
jgi:hypothetical protein